MKQKLHKPKPDEAAVEARLAEGPTQTAVEAFESAVEEKAVKDATRLAKALVESALAGHIQSLKFVCELLERRRAVAAEVAEQSVPNFAEIWAAEPEWKDDGSGAQEKWDILLPRTQ
jgi:hypothetical protein